jgi:hypothetical protein
MTGIMPYPKRQKTASGGGFKGKTPLGEQNKTLFSSEAFVYKAKTSFCSVSFCSLGLSHFARSPTTRTRTRTMVALSPSLTHASFTPLGGTTSL